MPVAPLFDWTIAASVRALCGGNAGAGCIERVAAFASPIAGLFTIVAVFAIARRLFGVGAALAAAVLLATMPSIFMDVTLLGVVDHHSGEVLFSTLTLLGLVDAVQRRDSDRRGADLAAARAGMALGAYLLTWTSGSFFVAAIALWAGIAYSLDPNRGSTRLMRSLTIVLAMAAVLGLVFAHPFTPKRSITLLALGGTAGGLAALEVAVRAWQRASLPRWAFGAAVLIAGAAVAGMLWVVARPIADAAVANAMRLLPASRGGISEAQPMTAQGGVVASLWWMFRTGAIAAIPGAVLLLFTVRQRVELLLLATWTAVTFAAAVGQIRFGAYLAIPVALLGGWAIALVATMMSGRRGGALVAFVIALMACYPNVRAARFNGTMDWGIPAAWHESLEWMLANTPDPFGNPAAYVDPAANSRAAYTVIDWWQHGYWIVRQARRVPVANPTQAGAPEAAAFFTETDPAAALTMLRNARARYIVAGDEVPMHPENTGGYWMHWFDNMFEWVATPRARYYEALDEIRPDGWSAPVFVYYPDYYRAMAHHLYLFGGAAVVPRDSSWVVTITGRRNAYGDTVRIASNLQQFATFEDAQAEVARRGDGEHRLVGTDPRQSPVPLDALSFVRVVYDSSQQSRAFPGLPAARIFEVTR